LTDLYENREKLDETARLCYERATSPCYDWDNIAPQFAGLFQEVLDGSYGDAHATQVEEPVSKKEKKKEKRKKRLVGAVA
jgi:hypothetical protein